MESGSSPRSGGSAPGPPVGSAPELPSPYGGPIPPGGWHRPVPPKPVPGELAGWWSRVGAAVIDGVIVSMPGIVVLLVLAALLWGPVGGISISDHETGALVGFLAVLLSLLLVVSAVFITAVLYAPLTMRREGAHNGQTWGKQLLAIRVVRMSGEPQTFGSAALREVAVKLLLFGIVGGTLASVPTILDGLWPLWDDQNRALHDMLVDTRVIRA